MQESGTRIQEKLTVVRFLSYHDRAIWRSGDRWNSPVVHPISRSPDYQGRRSRREPSMILAMVDDLLFLSKIQQTARHLGAAVGSARLADLPRMAIEDAPNALIIDLNHRSGKA